MFGLPPCSFIQPCSFATRRPLGRFVRAPRRVESMSVTSAGCCHYIKRFSAAVHTVCVAARTSLWRRRFSPALARARSMHEPGELIGIVVVGNESIAHVFVDCRPACSYILRALVKESWRIALRYFCRPPRCSPVMKGVCLRTLSLTGLCDVCCVRIAFVTEATYC